MELSDYRAEMDRIDRALVALFVERMETSARIAAYKKAHQLPVLDAAREEEKLRTVSAQVPTDLQTETAALYTLLMELSRGYQDRLLTQETP